MPKTIINKQSHLLITETFDLIERANNLFNFTDFCPLNQDDHEKSYYFDNPVDLQKSLITDFLNDISMLFSSEAAFIKILKYPENKIPSLFVSSQYAADLVNNPQVISIINKVIPGPDYENIIKKMDLGVYPKTIENTFPKDYSNIKNPFFIDIESNHNCFILILPVISNVFPHKENLIDQEKMILPAQLFPVAQCGLIFKSPADIKKIKSLTQTFALIVNFLSCSLEKRIKIQIITDAKEKYKMFLDQSKDTIWAADLNFNFIYMSPAVKALRGYTAREALNQPVNEMFVPESLNKIFEIYSQARDMLATNPNTLGWPDGIEVLAKCKDGSTIWNEVTAQFTRDSTNQVTGFVGISRDIDRRKKIEEQLEYKRKFENLITKFAVDFINIPIETIEKTILRALEEIGKFQSCDSSWLFLSQDNGKTMSLISQWLAPETENEMNLWQNIDISKYPYFVNMLFTNKIFSLNSLNDLPAYAENEKNLLSKRNVKSFIMAPVIIKDHVMGFIGMDHKKNEVKWSEDIETIINMSGKIFSNVLSRKMYEEELNKHKSNLENAVKKRTQELENSNKTLLNEINSRKETEIKLKKSEMRFKAVFENSLDCIILVNKSLEILFSNNAAKKHSKENQLPLTEKNLTKLKKLFPGFYSSWVKHITNTFETGKPENREDSIIKNNRTISIEATFSPVKDEKDTIFAVAVIYRDVTKKKEMQQKLLKTEKLEALGLLAGGIAHDFNNYLTVIMSTSSLVAHELAGRQTPKNNIVNNNEEILKKINNITISADKASDLAKQLLTLSKGGNPIKSKTDINKIIKESLQINLESFNINFKFRPSQKVKPFSADPGQINQVITNLIINARQALSSNRAAKTKNKMIQIKTDFLADYTPDENNFAGDYVYISIKDNGPGIPVNILNSIFDPFFTTKTSGTGIGLTLIHSIIKKHDGHLKVSSQIGKGTTFEIFIPALPVKKQEIMNIKEFPDFEFSDKKILFMDDIPEIRDTMKETLTFSNFEIELAAKGEEALEKYIKAHKSKKPFDLIILDLTIKNGMGGLETLNMIKNINPHVIAVVSSGYSQDPVMSDYKKYGFKGALYKPYKADEIKKVLKGLF
jgi:PAS domain S-box-containing protein